MDKPIIIERKPWANPKEVEETMEKLRGHIAKHGLASVAIAGETMDGNVLTLASRSENVYSLVGAMMQLCMELLGFAQRSDRSVE